MNSDLQPPCRYQNTPYKELSIAAAEQMKITEIRLRQLVGEPASTSGAAESAERRTGQMRGHLGESHQKGPPVAQACYNAGRVVIEGTDLYGCDHFPCLAATARSRVEMFSREQIYTDVITSLALLPLLGCYEAFKLLLNCRPDPKNPRCATVHPRCE